MIRILLAVVISLGVCKPLHGQAFRYPILPASATSIDGFKAERWTIIDSAFGDLNKDGLKDAAFVLEYQDTAMEILPPDTIAEPSIPRILVIAFRNSTGDYSLAAQNNLFLLRSTETDLFHSQLRIDKRGVLHIHYEFSHGDAEYKFRYQKNDFYLIGYTQHGIAGGEYMEDDYNFLTRKHRHESNTDLWAQPRAPESTIEAITAPPLQSFKTFIRPGMWPVEEDGMVLENK